MTDAAKPKNLVALRKQAEQAVADMPDGPLKTSAFEVILNHLLSTGPQPPAAAPPAPVAKKGAAKTGSVPQGEDRSVVGRIMVLREEGFFQSLRTIGETKSELAAHGWLHPLTALSGAFLTLVQRRQLRRQRVTAAKRSVWKYSNP